MSQHLLILLAAGLHIYLEDFHRLQRPVHHIDEDQNLPRMEHLGGVRIVAGLRSRAFGAAPRDRLDAEHERLHQSPVLGQVVPLGRWKTNFSRLAVRLAGGHLEAENATLLLKADRCCDAILRLRLLNDLRQMQLGNGVEFQRENAQNGDEQVACAVRLHLVGLQYALDQIEQQLARHNLYADGQRFVVHVLAEQMDGLRQHIAVELLAHVMQEIGEHR